MSAVKRINLTRSLALRFIALALCLSAATVRQARASEKESVLRACEREFGAAVDAKQNLFEVNASFVLQAKFDARGALDMISVSPKYFFEETHPEWTEPHHWPLLSRSEFAAVLAHVDSIRPRGRWVWSSGDTSVVTNMTHRFMDEYENAFVERGDYADIGVRFVSVYFMREVSGVVARSTGVSELLRGRKTPPPSLHLQRAATSSAEVRSRACASGAGRASAPRGRVGSRCGVSNACGR